MPITAWLCRECGGRERPLDHFATTDCGLKINPDYPATVLHCERSHYRFGKRQIGVTDVLGCPRAAAAKADVDYAVDPVTLMAPNRGTAWHRLVEEAYNSDPVQMANHILEPELEASVSGLIEGVRVVTEVDRLDKPRGLIRDWKTQNDFAASDDSKGPKPEHIAQLSLGAELTEQTLGWRPSRGIIDLCYNVKPGLRTHFIEPLWPIEEVLGFKPLEGPTTVRDHLHMLDRWVRGEVKWQDLPLTGESMKIGKSATACDYCSVAGPCKTAAKGAAF